MSQYPTLVLKSGRDRSVINRHPWIFSGAVKELPKANTGNIIRVTDNQHTLLGYGFFDPKSQITCRIFEFTKEERSFDHTYWTEKLTAIHTWKTA
ncbi:MAG TPA: hypothetical protein PKD40_09655, partial [Saprospiraceae bacterium]|nr:hypothetical protein [Saprospiraceae bacterium]